MSNLDTMVFAGDTAMCKASVLDVHKIQLQVNCLKEEKSVDVYILNENNYVDGEGLNQGRKYACKINHAHFGKEKSTCINNTWKEMGLYADERGRDLPAPSPCLI